MAYRFSAESESAAHQVRRILLEETAFAISQLRIQSPDERDNHIHEARKSVKKIRALLRLAGHTLAEKTFEKQNRQFRRVGHQLSQLRDASAMLETLAALPVDAEEEESREQLRQSLEVNKAALYQDVKVDVVLASAAAALEKIRPTLEDLPLKAETLADLEAGLVNSYAKGRRALKAARRDTTADHLHRFRRRVKDHWYHTRLVTGVQPEIGKRTDLLRELETLLGEGHNLHVLRQNCKASGIKGEFLTRLKAHENELSVRALALGDSLYSSNKRQFRQLLAAQTAIKSASSNGVSSTADTETTAHGSKHSRFKPALAAH